MVFFSIFLLLFYFPIIIFFMHGMNCWVKFVSNGNLTWNNCGNISIRNVKDKKVKKTLQFSLIFFTKLNFWWQFFFMFFLHKEFATVNRKSLCTATYDCFMWFVMYMSLLFLLTSSQIKTVLWPIFEHCTYGKIHVINS